MVKRGFTLIELLIVIAIIGIIAAIAIPNLIVALHKSKQKATMADMKNVGTAVESYITDNYMAPGAGGINTVSGLYSILVPFHTKKVPEIDGWGAELRYQSQNPAAGEPDVYSIISYGRKNVAEVIVSNQYYIVTSIQDLEKDICFSNGVFTYGPKTK